LTTEPVPRGGALVGAESWLGRVTALILMVALGFGLIVPKLAGGALLLLALIAIVWFEPGLKRHGVSLDRHERLLVFAVLAFVGIWLANWVGHGLDAVGRDDVGRILRLLLIIPIALYLGRVDGLERGWWTGLALGCATAGGYALWFVLSDQPGEWAERVGGPTNPIYFGGIVLAFALMLVPRITDTSLAASKRALAALAVALAMLASALSGSRGAWLALPPLMLLYLTTLGTRQTPRARLGVPALILIFFFLLALLPGVPLGERLLDAWTALTRDQAVPLSREDTLGIRWALWRLSGDALQSAWLFGLGPDGFRTALEQAAEAGALPEWMLEYHHPHNQYFSMLLIGGVPMLLALVLLLGIPIRRFAQLWHTGLERSRLIGWSGLVALTVIAVMGLSESLLQRNAGIVWLALLTGAGFGLVRDRQRAELNGPIPARRHSLGVIMICRDEADRIEQALQSVHGWADQIVVLDSGSRDATPEICRRYADTFEVTDWPGFGRQKQRALARAGTDWVLSLDADEVVSEALKREIDLVLSRARPHYAGYRLPWRTLAFGTTLYFGHWARAPLRLVRRDQARFTDVPVHEKLVMLDRQATGRLEGELIHRVFRDPAHARAKLAGYARLQAGARYAAGRRASRPGAWLRAGFNLIDNFVLRGAFLDGAAGWKMSRLQAGYTLAKYLELASLSRTA